MANCPAAFIEEIVRGVLPVFVSVTFCARLVVPTACFLKLISVVGEKLAVPVLSKNNLRIPNLIGYRYIGQIITIEVGDS